MLRKGQDRRVGQGWGPEGWPRGGTGSGRRGLGAAKAGCTRSGSCRAACPSLQAEPCAHRGHLGITLEQDGQRGYSGTATMLLHRNRGPREVRENPEGGRGQMGQTEGWREGPGLPTSSPLHWLLHMSLQGQGQCPSPCEAPPPMGTARLPQSASPQPSARHSPTALVWGGVRGQVPTGDCLLEPQAGQAAGNAGHISVR